MEGTLYILVFLWSLVSGVALSILGHRRGRTWLEMLQAHALLFGIGGFAGSLAFLTGTPALVAGLGCLFPALWVSVRRTHRLLSRRTEHKIPGPPEDSADPGELAVARAARADFIEVNRRLRRRIHGAALAAGLPLVGLGWYYGSWPAVLMGGVTTIAGGLLARYITKPLKEGDRRAEELELEETSSPLSLPRGPGS